MTKIIINQVSTHASPDCEQEFVSWTNAEYPLWKIRIENDNLITDCPDDGSITTVCTVYRTWYCAWFAGRRAIQTEHRPLS